MPNLVSISNLVKLKAWEYSPYNHMVIETYDNRRARNYLEVGIWLFHLPKPPHAKSWLIGKDPDAGRDWGQEEKGTTEDEMAGWHHQLDGREFEWTPGVGDGQGDLPCCNSWGRKESDTAEQLNWAELWDAGQVCYYLLLSVKCRQEGNLPRRVVLISKWEK